MADILIRGMENIPAGQEFVIVENIDFERYLYNRETGAAFHLVPLQEGHGRLIDGDALMNNIGDVPYKGSVRRVLMSAPTIVPAEGGTEDGN